MPEDERKGEEERRLFTGRTVWEENTALPLDCEDPEHDIPVRKIELVSESRFFTKERQEILFTAVVSPSNASYAEEIEYRITTVLGIESNLAKVEYAKGREVSVRCLGDGEFYLRALCKNGTDKYHILSQIRLQGRRHWSGVFRSVSIDQGRPVHPFQRQCRQRDRTRRFVSVGKKLDRI